MNTQNANLSPPPFWRRPWLGVLSRSLAAVLGGYALAASASALMAVILPLPRSQAVLTGMLIAIVLAACAALWAFAVRSAFKAWLGIATPAVLMALATWLLRSAA